MKGFKLDVVTPEKTVVSEQVESLVVPAWDGYLGILADHAPLLCVIRPGQVEVIKEGKGRQFAVSTGFLQVGGNRAILLADSLEESHEIDVERARRALERAASVDARIQNRDAADSAAERARARIRVAERRSEGHG